MPLADTVPILYDLARDTARHAAQFALANRPAGRVAVADTKSSATDAVTELDRACENLIRQRILSARPNDTFLGEETTEHRGTSDIGWIVDPIDGTVNFIYGIPASAVAIAATYKSQIVAASVVNIFTGEEWAAQRGAGAYRITESETTRIHAPEPPPLQHALVATGFNYVPEVRAHQAAAMSEFIPQVRDIRRGGSAALDLCAVASGQLDAFAEQGLKPWDLAAGALIAQESGITVTGLHGEANERLTVACHPALLTPLMRLVNTTGL